MKKDLLTMTVASEAELDAAGIYLLLNRVNGKYYVGQSQNMYRRMTEHRCDTVRKRHLPIYKAIAKHGWSSFAVVVLERVEDLSLLDGREQCWLDTLRPYDEDKGYNVAAFARAPRGWKEAAEVVKRKRLRKHSEKTKQQLTGRRFSAYARAKMSRNHADVSGSNNPFYGKKHGEQTKQKILASRGKEWKEAIADFNIKTKGKPVQQVDAETEEVVAIFPSARAAARQAGISQPSMNRRVNGMVASPLGGYHYRYAGGTRSCYYDGGFNV